MKNAVKLIILLYMIFIAVLSVAGSLGGVPGAVIELVAYGLPLFIGYSASRRFKREREEMAGVSEAEHSLLTVRGVAESIPLIAPAVALIFLVSYVTSLVLTALGRTGGTVADEPIAIMLISHAILPALLEEMLFRYLPMKLLMPYSGRWCVILSSVAFALVHLDLFQIPYALLAGVIFIVVDMAYGSVLPSMLMHFVNNAASVLWIKWGADPGFALWYILVMAVLALLSLIPALLMRKRYIARMGGILDVGEGVGDYYAPTIFVAATLLLSLFNL